jgi:glyoxylase-like metal-dependent hydrolase (beta-lactamase superfamily II)/8-oxo-dGTP pyrophosphatase MutT (NUDIX family)
LRATPDAAGDKPSVVGAPAIRDSATIVVLRDGAAGLEVLLLQRAERDDANGGAWVFPGGLVDAADGGSEKPNQFHDGPSDADHRFVTAALRECFEECGLLFARDDRGAMPVAAALEAWHPWRSKMNRHEHTWRQLMQATGWTAAADALQPLSHWITPMGMKKRYNTRFFIGAAPVGQVVSVDHEETTSFAWMRPADALAAAGVAGTAGAPGGAGPRAEPTTASPQPATKRMKLMAPTQRTLEDMLPHATVADAMTWAHQQASLVPIQPRLGRHGDKVRPVMPHEPAYAELGHLDPQGRGTAAYVITPGQAVRLSPRVIRVTAPNPGVMTGPGTNTYLVGGGQANAWAVIDPGPMGDEHLQAIMAAAPGPIRWILATHTHMDHSPLAMKLAAVTGATVHGRLADHATWQDASFKPNVELNGQEVLQLTGCDATLHVLHTPGHASNHLCFLLREEAMLFTGDHVMQRVTVVINPPDGDMAAYIGSLGEIASQHAGLKWLAPGHGFLMDEPVRVLQGIVAHRLKREAKVLASLQRMLAAPRAASQHGQAQDRSPEASQAVALQDLVRVVYDDVPPGLHPMALRSLTAHLHKLEADSMARVDAQGRWALTTPRP